MRETIDSAMSGPLALSVPATVADAAVLGSRTVVAPRTATVEPPASARSGDRGGFEEHLPYGSAEIEPDDGTEVPAVAAGATGSGPLPQGGPASVAAGLVLLTAGIHLRRFLGKGETR